MKSSPVIAFSSILINYEITSFVNLAWLGRIHALPEWNTVDDKFQPGRKMLQEKMKQDAWTFIHTPLRHGIN